MKAATQVRKNAHAPYSGFAVGAAILDEQGDIHVGCNVENAAYSQCQCAEASAIGALIASGRRRIDSIAVAGPTGIPCTPCGGCRQRIREFATPKTTVLICSDGAVIARYELDDLLPASFGPENLNHPR